MGSNFILLEKCKDGDGIRTTTSHSSGNRCMDEGNNSYQQTAPSVPQQPHLFAARIPDLMVHNQQQSFFDELKERIKCRTSYDSRVIVSTPPYFGNWARTDHSHATVSRELLDRKTAAGLAVIRLSGEVTKLFGNALTPSEN